jgi:hypothetical protein
MKLTFFAALSLDGKTQYVIKQLSRFRGRDENMYRFWRNVWKKLYNGNTPEAACAGS